MRKHTGGELEDLAEQAARADPVAAYRLHQRLSNDLVYIVRRVLETAAASTPMDRWVLAEAERVVSDRGHLPVVSGEPLIRVVAERLTHRVIDQLRRGQVPARSLQETIGSAVSYLTGGETRRGTKV